MSTNMDNCMDYSLDHSDAVKIGDNLTLLADHLEGQGDQILSDLNEYSDEERSDSYEFILDENIKNKYNLNNADWISF